MNKFRTRATYYSGHKAGEMNKTEKEYSEYLKFQKKEGYILDYFFEDFKLKIGCKICWYTPDFMVINSKGQIEFHEVKGYWLDDAKVKIKAAADKYPFIFFAVTKGRKKDVEKWNFEEFTA